MKKIICVLLALVLLAGFAPAALANVPPARSVCFAYAAPPHSVTPHVSDVTAVWRAHGGTSAYELDFNFWGGAMSQATASQHDLNGQFTRFSAQLRVTQMQGPTVSVRIQDGNRLIEQFVLFNTGTRSISVDVTGVQQLVIVFSSNANARMTVSNARLTVDPAQITLVEELVVPSRITMTPSSTAQIPVTIRPANAEFATLRYGTFHPAIATVDADGMITAHATGTTFISVTTAGGGSRLISLRVVNPIFGTGRPGTFVNWLLFIFAFGWIWMWF